MSGAIAGRGPEGPQGPAGPAGPQGPTGPPGLEDLTAATPTTLPPGSPATAEVVELSQGHFQLRLGIPQGADGHSNPTMSVGTVTTVPYDQGARVTVTPTPVDWSLQAGTVQSVPYGQQAAVTIREVVRCRTTRLTSSSQLGRKAQRVPPVPPVRPDPPALQVPRGPRPCSAPR